MTLAEAVDTFDAVAVRDTEKVSDRDKSPPRWRVTEGDAVREDEIVVESDRCTVAVAPDSEKDIDGESEADASGEWDAVRVPAVLEADREPDATGETVPSVGVEEIDREADCERVAVTLLRVTVTLPDVESERDSELVADAGSWEREAEKEVESDAVVERLFVWVEEKVRVTVREPRVPVLEAVNVSEAVNEADRDAGNGDTDSVSDALCVTVMVGFEETDMDGESVAVAVTLREVLDVSASVTVRDWVTVAVHDGDSEVERVTESDRVSVTIREMDTVGDGDSDRLTDWDEVTDDDAVCDADADTSSESVAEDVGETETERVNSAVALCVSEGVPELVAETDGVSERDTLRSSVWDAVNDPLREKETDSESCSVFEDEVDSESDPVGSLEAEAVAESDVERETKAVGVDDMDDVCDKSCESDSVPVMVGGSSSVWDKLPDREAETLDVLECVVVASPDGVTVGDTLLVSLCVVVTDFSPVEVAENDTDGSVDSVRDSESVMDDVADGVSAVRVRESMALTVTAAESVVDAVRSRDDEGDALGDAEGEGVDEADDVR